MEGRGRRKERTRRGEGKVRERGRKKGDGNETRGRERAEFLDRVCFPSSPSKKRDKKIRMHLPSLFSELADNRSEDPHLHPEAIPRSLSSSLGSSWMSERGLILSVSALSPPSLSISPHVFPTLLPS